MIDNRSRQNSGEFYSRSGNPTKSRTLGDKRIRARLRIKGAQSESALPKDITPGAEAGNSDSRQSKIDAFFKNSNQPRKDIQSPTQTQNTADKIPQPEQTPGSTNILIENVPVQGQPPFGTFPPKKLVEGAKATPSPPSQSKIGYSETEKPENIAGEDEPEGNAAKHLQDNMFAEQILAMIGDTEQFRNNSCVRQLHHAIFGNAKQCPSCLKYSSGKRYPKRHEKTCKNGLQRRVNFARLADGSYFCYFGCKILPSRDALVDHLLSQHEAKLKDWGLAPHLLSAHTTYRANLEARREQKRASKEPDNTQQEKGQSTKQTGSWNPIGKKWFESILVKILVRNAAVHSTDNPWPQCPPNTSRVVRRQRCLHKVVGMDRLRADFMLAWATVQSLENELELSESFPSLHIAPAVVTMYGDKLMVLRHKYDARTLGMLRERGDQQIVKRCLLSTLQALCILHDKHSIFQGGIRADTVAMSSRGQIHFLDWSHCSDRSISQPFTKPHSASYWFFPYHTGGHNLFTQDILALLLTIADYLCHKNKAFSFTGRLNQVTQGRSDKIRVPKLVCLLQKYLPGTGCEKLLTKVAHSRSIDHEELVREVSQVIENDF